MTGHPIRIQRKRTKGWRMPPNTVYVGRGTILGNPFWVGQKAMVLFSVEEPPPLPANLDPNVFRSVPPNKLVRFPRPLTIEDVMRRYEDYVHRTPEVYRKILSLEGCNVCCWCRVDQPCHGDIVLRIANR